MSLETPKNILFVDDEESILDVAREFFENRGYHVLTAENGRVASQLIEKEQIDCCFTDINMPEMDGLELAEYIRKHDNTLPVVIMTGYPSLENTIKTLKNGVVDFLVKPVNLKQMELCVQRVFRERELFIKNVILTKELESKRRIETLNNELLHKVDELNTLNHIMSDFTVVSASSEVFTRVVEMSIELTHADEARLYMVNEAIDAPFEIASFQAGDACSCDLLDNQAIDPVVEQMILDIQTDQKPLLISNNNGHGKLPDKIRSLMLVPLTIRHKIFGVLSVSALTGKIRFTEKELYYLTFMTNRAAYAIENLALYENIFENLFATLYAFVRAIEARDPYTEQHSNRVTRIALALSHELGCTEEEQDILKVAGRLHDIGKIGIRDEILLKPDRLTVEEYNVIKEHPVIGAEIVGQLGLWDREKQIIRCHHERFDGNGYPDGLGGDDIPLLGRILSVADVYDAIASDRAYRKRMEESRILDIMYGGAGTQFDPLIIKSFKKLYENGCITDIEAL
ncbi:MAG: response regulator [Desulfobacteraceae bacterium]|nr:response regulator [Desulfobacteraceae bacterium]